MSDEKETEETETNEATGLSEVLCRNPFRCKHGFHKWTMWNKLTFTKHPFEQQQRRCVRCGLIEQKYL